MDITCLLASLNTSKQNTSYMPNNAPKQAHETRLHVEKDASELVTYLPIPLRPTTCQTRLSW